MANAGLFFQTYMPAGAGKQVIEVGAQDVNGSLRQVAPAGATYIGVDFVPGKGVDVVLDDPYKLPFADASADACISSSVFEHSEMFWLLFLEMLRIVKPDGLVYLNAPSNGDFHRYPVDCWRFYPDSGRALVRWARRSGYAPCMLESFVSDQYNDIWNDFVAVFVKDEAHAHRYPARMLERKADFANGLRLGSDEIVKPTEASEDRRTIVALGARLDDATAPVWKRWRRWWRTARTGEPRADRG